MYFLTESFFPKKLWVQRLNLKRITNNLISNAIKHTTNGQIDVSIRLETICVAHFISDFRIVGAQPMDGKEYITFEIKDNGNGIKKELMEAIFDNEYFKDFTNKENSDLSGLGLSQCK